MINLTVVFTGLIDAHVTVTVRFNYFYFCQTAILKRHKVEIIHESNVTAEKFKMKKIIISFIIFNVFHLIMARTIFKPPNPKFYKTPR